MAFITNIVTIGACNISYFFFPTVKAGKFFAITKVFQLTSANLAVFSIAFCLTLTSIRI